MCSSRVDAVTAVSREGHRSRYTLIRYLSLTDLFEIHFLCRLLLKFLSVFFSRRSLQPVLILERTAIRQQLSPGFQFFAGGMLSLYGPSHHTRHCTATVAYHIAATGEVWVIDIIALECSRLCVVCASAVNEAETRDLHEITTS